MLENLDAGRLSRPALDDVLGDLAAMKKALEDASEQFKLEAMCRQISERPVPTHPQISQPGPASYISDGIYYYETGGYEFIGVG